MHPLEDQETKQTKQTCYFMVTPQLSGCTLVWVDTPSGLAIAHIQPKGAISNGSDLQAYLREHGRIRYHDPVTGRDTLKEVQVRWQEAQGSVYTFGPGSRADIVSVCQILC